MVNKDFAAAICITVALSTAVNVWAQAAEEIIVVGVTPIGAGIDRNKVPFPVQSATAEDLQAGNNLGLSDFLRNNFASISVNDAQNNPLQADIQYRGFTASPLLGLSQGLAVYQNSVRINEPLGDTVNWDLLPESAINGITLSGGASPLFGLNSLGGSLVVDMKDGFNFQGTALEINSGSFGRTTASLETGNTIEYSGAGTFAYYGNLSYFEEDGWRAQSPSESLNFYGSVGWQTDSALINLNYQYGDSDLVGNGSAPIELLAIDRSAIFTGPDITANELHMVSVDVDWELSENIGYSASVFFRENNSDSFNGDGSEFTVCNLGGMAQLLEGLEEELLEELGLDDDDVCEDQFSDANALQDFLNQSAQNAGSDELANIDAFDSDELSGSGLLSDDAINNISDRSQHSTGADFQFSFNNKLMGRSNLFIVGASYFRGESEFNSVLELTRLNPITRLTTGLGLGAFVDEGSTNIDTLTQTASAYFMNTLDLSDTVAITLSARANDTEVELRDLSGLRPELNGDHDFFRVNPALGLTWQFSTNDTLYASFSQSSRAPTPIELACNEGVFDLAVEFAIAAGEDPADVDFECRLPNAFLADPPLEDVVAQNFELGIRGEQQGFNYHLGVFHTTNRDDILFQTTGRATGLFANVDKTQRMGFESNVKGNYNDLDWFASYSYVEATFEDTFQVLSPNHDFANEDGEITVNNGDKIPGVPDQQFKAGADYHFTERFSIGVDFLYYSSQIIRGDESNQLDEVPSYALANLRARYSLNDRLEVFAKVENLFDTDFETFGLLGEEPGELEVPIIEDLTNPVFLGPGAPRAGFIGVRYRF